MTVQKLSYPSKENAVQEKINEIIDNLGGGGGGSVDIDNVSITENSSNEIQTIGVINQNAPATAIKTWTGTKAQYNAIVTKDSNTLYNITDDVINNNILDVHTNYARIGELLICWGTTSSKKIVVNSSRSATWNVSFPQGVSFADTSYEATATQGANVSYFANVTHVVQNKSTSGFDIYAYSQAVSGTTSGDIIFRWIAIGKGA